MKHILPATLALAAFVWAGSTMPAAAAGDMGVPHPNGTMAFTLAGTGGNCGNCEWIAAEGPITARTPDDFERFLRDWPGLDARIDVDLNSPGGDLDAGLRLGKAFRAHKMRTEVGRTADEPADPKWQAKAPGTCASACAYAFLGGVKRTAKSGELGFHQFRFAAAEAPAAPGSAPQSVADAQRAAGGIALYLHDMGIDGRLLALSSSADPAELVRPDASTMLALGVINVTDAGVFSGWSLKPYQDGTVVTGRVSGQDYDDLRYTFYCRAKAPGVVFLMSALRYLSADPKQAAADDSALRKFVWGSKVSIGGRGIREAKGYQSIADARVDGNDTWLLIYELSAAEFGSALATGSLEIRISGPHSLGSYGFVFAPPMEGLAAPARVFLKNCI
jgi:hypothetical protein